MKLVYLCGPMEFAKDNGLLWRRKFDEVLNREFGFKCIIPNDEEENIIKGIDMRKLKKENLSEYKDLIRKFIEMDLNFVDKCDLIICKWEGEVSSGTMGEMTHAYYLKKTSYLVTSMPTNDIPGWFLSCFTEVFSSLEDLVEHLRG